MNTFVPIGRVIPERICAADRSCIQIRLRHYVDPADWLRCVRILRNIELPPVHIDDVVDFAAVTKSWSAFLYRQGNDKGRCNYCKGEKRDCCKRQSLPVLRLREGRHNHEWN